MEVHLPILSPPLRNSSSSFMVRFCLDLKQKMFICLPIIIEFNIYKWVTMPPPPSPSLEKVKAFNKVFRLPQNINVG